MNDMLIRHRDVDDVKREEKKARENLIVRLMPGMLTFDAGDVHVMPGMVDNC